MDLSDLNSGLLDLITLNVGGVGGLGPGWSGITNCNLK